jgi:hypothetical protein
MNPQKQEEWKARALDVIFEALAASKPLEGKFAYKGARVLAKLLKGDHRQSYDIDMNLTQSFVSAYPYPDDQASCLREEISISIETFFRGQNPIRYKLKSVKLVRQPKEDHPHGWNAFAVRIAIDDLMMMGILGLPILDLDIAAPEDLGPHALAQLKIGEHEITAYTLERIAGEKLRAFLSSLPAYRAKMDRPGDAVRAKDIYDLCRILRSRPIDDDNFWRTVGDEFARACRSRYIDCAGFASFEEQLDVTRATYESDSIIPNDIDFDAAWGCIGEIVTQLTAWRVIPFEHPIQRH